MKTVYTVCIGAEVRGYADLDVEAASPEEAIQVATQRYRELQGADDPTPFATNVECGPSQGGIVVVSDHLGNDVTPSGIPLDLDRFVLIHEPGAPEDVYRAAPQLHAALSAMVAAALNDEMLSDSPDGLRDNPAIRTALAALEDASGPTSHTQSPTDEGPSP